ncbi:MAG: VanW family protein [bacterium]|nr:VanW family protein [bacterium]
MKKIGRKKIPLVLLILTALVLYSYLLFLVYFYQGIFPGISIASQNVSRLSPQSAAAKVSAELQKRSQNPLTLKSLNQTFTLDLQKASPQSNLQQQVQAAYNIGRSGNSFEDLIDQTKALFGGINLPLEITYKDEAFLTSQFDEIDKQVKKDPLEAKLSLKPDVTIIPSQNGQKLDKALLQTQIDYYLALEGPAPQTLPLQITKPQFTTQEAQPFQDALIKVKSSPLTLHYEKEIWTIDTPTLFNLLKFPQTKPSLFSLSFGENTLDIRSLSLGSTTLRNKESVIDSDKLADFLADLAKKINRPTQDARFVVQGTSPLKVSEFQEAKEGKELDLVQTATLITSSLEKNTASDITLPVKVTQPKVTTANINSFGIKQFIGGGVSNFAHSIENRIYNVKLAASHLNGVLIPPGEIFSFNNTVGDVSGATGYKPAYVIKSGRTVLDDGGGVCQVSTTLFRALLNTGLPIVERTAHAYRVGYYEQGFPPGLDATVFSPSVDLKFKNDTPAHLLIQAYTVGLTLYVDFYGTPDGRVSTVSTPIVTNQTPPPPDLRQDDPTLPKGEVKQVDWSAWGANVSFKRTVKRGEETLISETWRSNYKPWQAIFLVGTKE